MHAHYGPLGHPFSPIQSGGSRPSRDKGQHLCPSSSYQGKLRHGPPAAVALWAARPPLVRTVGVINGGYSRPEAWSCRPTAQAVPVSLRILPAGEGQYCLPQQLLGASVEPAAVAPAATSRLPRLHQLYLASRPCPQLARRSDQPRRVELAKGHTAQFLLEGWTSKASGPLLQKGARSSLDPSPPAAPKAAPPLPAPSSAPQKSAI